MKTSVSLPSGDLIGLHGGHWCKFKSELAATLEANFVAVGFVGPAREHRERVGANF